MFTGVSVALIEEAPLVPPYKMGISEIIKRKKDRPVAGRTLDSLPWRLDRSIFFSRRLFVFHLRKPQNLALHLEI